MAMGDIEDCEVLLGDLAVIFAVDHGGDAIVEPLDSRDA
jgi:hypothetical protein